MPLNPFGNLHQLFTSQWIDRVGATQELGHEAEVRLVSFHRTGSIDSDTGTKEVTKKIHYDNLTARIQPMYTPSYMESPVVDTLVKRVRVQMNKIIERIDLGWELEVISCPKNPTLETLQFTNMETTNSSNNVDTTLLFQVNPRVNRGG